MEIDDHAVTTSGEMLHLWNDPTVGMSNPQLVVETPQVRFCVVCESGADTQKLFELLQKSFISGWEFYEEEKGV